MKRKTETEKKAQGTNARTRNPVMTLKAINYVPGPAHGLDEHGMKFYNRVCQVMIDNNVMSEAWVTDITAAAWLWSKYIENVKLVDEHGTIQMAQSGYRQKAPELLNATSILGDLEKRMKALCLTPADMNKLPKFEVMEDSKEKKMFK